MYKPWEKQLPQGNNDSSKKCYKVMGGGGGGGLLFAILIANNYSKPLQWNSNIVAQFEFELGIRTAFHTIPIRFCGKFLTTVKMIHPVVIKWSSTESA